MRVSGALAVPAILSVLSTAACGGPPVDLTKGLRLEAVSTGWFDAGIVEGNNKLVPSVTFKLRNLSDQSLPVLQVNVLFRRVSEQDEWGSGFLTAAGSSGLEPGATTDFLTVRSQLGYTGTESRQEMLRNPQFVDAKVDLYVKYGSTQWVKAGGYPIARQLIAQ